MSELQRRRASQANSIHGMTKTREYQAWNRMKGRCFNRSNPNYPTYGGRGISVCEEWRYDFEAFMRDMGPRPKGSSLDRIDNSAGYSPSNCRWASARQQANNRRSSHVLTVHGRSQTIAQWAAEINISEDAIQQRIVKLGWSAEAAVCTPVRRSMRCRQASE